MQVVNITEAKAQLSAILASIEKSGEEVLIKRMDKPIAKISLYSPESQADRLGLMEGEGKIPEDYDDWPEDISQYLGITE